MTPNLGERLLPCPFCGGEPKSDIFIRDSRSVACRCGASVDAYNPDASHKAITAWNTRAQSSLLKQLADTLELVMGKNSTNFKLKAPDYLIDQCDNTLAAYHQAMGGKE